MNIAGKLVLDEKRFKGQVPFHVYVRYISTGGYFAFFTTIGLYFLNTFIYQVTNYWAGKWAGRSYPNVESDTSYGVIYLIMMAIMFLFLILR